MLMQWKNIVNMSILPQTIYRFNVIPIKIPIAFVLQNRANNPKIYVEPQRLWIAKAIQRKKNKARGITLPDFKLY